jgi:hypothetical protein
VRLDERVSRKLVAAPVAAQPSLVAADPVALTGSGLAEIARVGFGGLRAVVVASSDKKLVVVPPVGVRTGNVRITTVEGRTWTVGTYTVKPGR